MISCKIISDTIGFFCLSKHKEVFRLSFNLKFTQLFHL